MKNNAGRQTSLAINESWVPTLPQEDTMIGGCLRDEDFVAWSLGLLPLVRRNFVCAHLEWCELCNDLMSRFMEVTEEGADRDSDNAPGQQAPGALFPEETERVRYLVERAAEKAALEMLQTEGDQNMEESVANHPSEVHAKQAEAEHKTKTSTAISRPREPFAKEQKRLELEGKQAVAIWAMRRFRPSLGTGVVLDAGSACFEVWRAMRAGIEGGEFDHIKVKTSNFGVLSDCTNATHVLQNTAVDLWGDMFDPQHEAFYVTESSVIMLSAFRPSEVYIGASGVEIEGSSLLIGFHGFLERQHKQLLLRFPCRNRIILTTAIKIGNAGGNVIDVLALDKADDKTTVRKAPIYLVTTVPASADKIIQGRLRVAQDNLFSSGMGEALSRKRLEVHWVTVDLNGNEVEDLVAPARVGIGDPGDAQEKRLRRRSQDGKR
jgi:hypothetical protein